MYREKVFIRDKDEAWLTVGVKVQYWPLAIRRLLT